MANIKDIVDRSAALEKKYGKYLKEDKPKPKASTAKGETAFEEEYNSLASRADEVAEVADGVSSIRDRAQVATTNADIRKKKQAVLSELAALRALIKKGKSSKDEQYAREQRVNELENRICNIPDGMNIARKKPVAAAPSRAMFGGKQRPHEVRLDMDNVNYNDFYQETEQNRAFQEEWEERKAGQDEHLEEIDRGLGNLQNIARDMQNEMNKQDDLIGNLETTMDKGIKSVDTNNQKLAGVLKKVRGTRNFCFDAILICIILAIAGYIYSIVGQCISDDL
eukprot:TRINITY_DN14817_c1_g1_i1.p2 TRINITY_DN14817_c1_g1~~TRINITY_DN14817_c1_g1_i1.p2  ORF type:complete len:281 (+),score=39.30 TRINITY_DN14817_c1_g1_i1:248-1090(+)